MNLPDNDRKEGISFGLLYAIAFNAGYTATPPSKDKGVDAKISHVAIDEHGHTESGMGIDVQLKASSSARIVGGEIKFSLESKYINRMADRNIAFQSGNNKHKSTKITIIPLLSTLCVDTHMRIMRVMR